MTRWLWFTVLLLLGCTLFNAPFVKAEDDEEPEVEVSEDAETVETEAPISHELSSSFLFPDNLDGKFTVGEVATALVVLTNLGDERVNISYIGAQLRSPFDLSYFIQNYTARGVGAFIEPQQQVTVEYKFMPDKSLEALEYWLTGFVTYNTGNGESADQQFVATWFNQTVTLLEKSEPFTAKLSVYIPLLAILAGGFVAREKFGKKKRKGGRKPAADAGAKAPAAAWSVDDLVYKAKPVVSKKDKKAGGKQGSSKKSN